MNISFIVHYPTDNGKFGCSRRCQYCNWQRLERTGDIQKSEPPFSLLKETLDGLSPEVRKGIKTITISGGGDPLYSEDINEIPYHTFGLMKAIMKAGFTVRIISREIWGMYLITQRLTEKELKKVRFSISIDQKSIKEVLGSTTIFSFISPYVDEFTIVPGVVFSADWVLRYILQFDKQLEILGYRGSKSFFLTVRENLRSTNSLPREEAHDAMAFMNKHLNSLIARWLPKSVCLEKNIYLIDPMPVFDNKTVLDGHDMTIDFERLSDFFCTDESCILYGGAARSKLASVMHKWRDNYNWDFNDFDVFVLSVDVKRITKYLRDTFGFQIEASFKKNDQDRRFVLRRKVDPSFKIVLYVVENLNIAWTIISEAAVGFNRFGYHKGNYKTFEGFSLDDLLGKKARILPHKWKYFNIQHRKSAEGNQLKKLKLSGCKIIPLSTAGKIKQKLYNLLQRITHGN